MPKLFTPTTVGALTLSNRVAMAPMTRCRATPDHVPTPEIATHYTARADAGLLITEGTAPTANGCGYARIPGLWSDEQVTGWRAVTDAVHAAGGVIAVQLMHTGRVSHANNMPAGADIIAPSASQLAGEMYTDQDGNQPYPVAREMTEADIEAALQGFVSAAKRARAAGFDAIELHGANGYLIDQFISPVTNQRTDAWGGDGAGRARFAVEAARRCAEAIGADRVGIRLSPFGVFNGITPWDGQADDFIALATEMGKLGLAWVHLVDHSGMGAPPVPTTIKTGIRDAFGGPIILCGSYDRDRAEADLEAGLADVIAFGRPFISNADLVGRLRDGAAQNPPDFSTFYTPGDAGYNDYPTLA